MPYVYLKLVYINTYLVRDGWYLLLQQSQLQPQQLTSILKYFYINFY